jgi:hypothetical protein
MTSKEKEGESGQLNIVKTMKMKKFDLQPCSALPY